MDVGLGQNFGIGDTYQTREPRVGYLPTTEELEALNALAYEKGQWEDESVFLTDKIAYMMRLVIRQARKFYYGIFDKPKDEFTGESKVWVPLTEWSVESVVKSVDLDTKDILIRPGTPEAVGITPLLRAVILNHLKYMEFGQLLNDLIRCVARDGTVVVKTYETINPRTGRKTFKSKIVDLLNIWIDPSADSIQEAPAIIERALMSEQDIQSMSPAWKNTEFVSFSLAVPRVIDTWGSGRGKLPYTEVWERWGKIKKSWITKDDADKNTWIDGHIVASGMGAPKIIHVLRANPRKDGMKPYEEAWYKRVDGRWYGRGISEMLFGLQEYSNAIVNIRKANSLVLQNGIFLIRKGSGLTPDMISSISAGGGLPVTDIARDVKQLQTQDVRQSSYTDEDRAYSLSDKVTGAHDITRGDIGRTGASATATLTQDRNIRDTFVLIQEGLGFFLERLILRHYIPFIKQTLKTSDMIRLSGEPEFISEIDNAIITARTDEFIASEVERTGWYPEQDAIEKFKVDHNSYLKGMGKNRFITYLNGMFDEDVDLDITITDERFNKVVAVQQLRDMLIAFSRLPVASSLNTDAIMREILNIMGLKGEFFLEQPQSLMLKPQIAQTGRLLKELPSGLPNEQTANANANGIPQMGGAVAGPGAMSNTGLPAGEQTSTGHPTFQERFNVTAPLSKIG